MRRSLPANADTSVPTRRGDRGAAMVEFALVSLLLVLLVVGILNFGLILSFKQDVTRAAAEGARTGAVAQPPGVVPPSAAADPRHVAATAGTEDAVEGFDKTCGVDGMDCDVIIHDCDTVPVAGSVAYFDNGVDDCVTVELTYDYDSFPLIVEPPILASVLPDTIRSKSVARLND